MLDQIQVTPAVDALSSALSSSYAIGPLEPAQVITQPVHLSSDQDITLLVPASLPLDALLADEGFVEGYECGYEWWGEEDEQQDWTVPRIVNEVYHGLYDAFEPCLHVAMAG